jgi:hypothetical protein
MIHTSIRALAAAAAATIVATISGTSAAATPTSDDAPAARPTSAARSAKTESAKPSPKRPLPNYDGRPPPPTTAGDVLIWIPRVVLSPVYLVTEYVVRRPLGALTVAAERGRWVEALYDVFTFGPNHSIGIVPTFFIDAGFRPSVGVYHFYDDFLVKGNELRAHATFGGPDWLRLTVADRFPVGPRAHVKLRLEAVHRPDYVFYGLGSLSRVQDRARYGSDFVDGAASFDTTIPGGFSASTYVGIRTVRFADRTTGTDPSLVQRARATHEPLPPGFDAGYTGFRTGARLAFDSRKPRPAPGSGVRVEGNLEYGADLRNPTESGWVRYGGAAGGFLDVNGHQRVLSLSAAVNFVDPLVDHEIPFTELVQLGGTGAFSGFYPGRLFGRSAATLSLEYRYPVWAFFDAAAQVAVGNVFDEHLSGFAADKLRLAFTFGVRTSGERDHSFNILVGAGTETFGQGARLDELRLVFGASQGF